MVVVPVECGVNIVHHASCVPFQRIDLPFVDVVGLVGQGKSVDCVAPALVLVEFLSGSVVFLDTQLLPDKLTLPLLWLGLVFNAQYGLIDLHDAVYGAVAGYGVLWCVYWGVWLVCHKEGLGYGDFKLLAAAGAWCGWQTLPMILLIASLGGIGYAIVSQLLQRRTITTIAFGPWLALGSMINLGYLAWISY